MITVYRAREYYVATEEVITSQRWFTREGAVLADLKIIEDTASEISEDNLEPGEQWTPLDPEGLLIDAPKK